MNVRKSLALLAAPLALALGGCATGFPAQVSRFQALPAPAGQSFFIQAGDPAKRGGLEFSQYADQIRRNLVGIGYSEAGSPSAASLLVNLDYGIDNGRERVVSTPGIRPGFGLGLGYGRPFYSRFGYGRFRRNPFYWGWYDPFWDDFGPSVSSFTVYHGYVNLDIRRASDGQAVFEGKAQAQSATNQLQVVVPNLIEAMFTNFPGNNGETVRITVPAERTARPSSRR